MQWTLYLLARNSDVQERLHEEVTSVLKPGERATASTLQKMHFLRGCIKETLRYVESDTNVANLFKILLLKKGQMSVYWSLTR